MISFLVRSQALMALSSALFVWICAALTGHELQSHWYFTAGVGCWAIYLADAGLFGIPVEDHVNLPLRAQFITRCRRSLLGLLILALVVVALGFCFFWPWPRPATWMVLLILGGAGAGYVFPLLRQRGRPGLRVKDVALWKPLFISAVWLAGGMLLAFIEGHPAASPAAPFWAIATLLLLLLLGDSIALDWRDRAGDAAAGVQTAAVRLGRACIVLLIGGAFAAGLVVLLVPGDRRWWIVGGSMALAHAASLALLPLANRRALLFYLGVAAWRFVGAAALLWVR